MTQTETVIREQFPFWQAVLDAPEITKLAGPHAVLVGCGTSYNLALSLAAAFNAAGHSAQAVPAHEWLRRRRDYAASGGQPPSQLRQDLRCRRLWIANRIE